MCLIFRPIINRQKELCKGNSIDSAVSSVFSSNDAINKMQSTTKIEKKISSASGKYLTTLKLNNCIFRFIFREKKRGFGG